MTKYILTEHELKIIVDKAMNEGYKCGLLNVANLFSMVRTINAVKITFDLHDFAEDYVNNYVKSVLDVYKESKTG